MALVTFQTYSGEDVDINPAMVQSVATYQHFDHDMDLPEEMYHTNRGGLREVNPAKREEADALRTSPRTIIQYGNTSAVVRGTIEQVRKLLAGK